MEACSFSKETYSFNKKTYSFIKETYSFNKETYSFNKEADFFLLKLTLNCYPKLNSKNGGFFSGAFF